MHLAIEKGNIEAAGILVGMEGIDINLRNCRGESPTDICIERDQKLACDLDIRTVSAQGSSIQKERQDNMRLMESLMAGGGRMFKFSAMISRTCETRSTLWTVQRARFLALICEVSENFMLL